MKIEQFLTFLEVRARMHEAEEQLLARGFSFPHVNYLGVAVG
jgi:hypothetical protein